MHKEILLPHLGRWCYYLNENSSCTTSNVTLYSTNTLVLGWSMFPLSTDFILLSCLSIFPPSVASIRTSVNRSWLLSCHQPQTPYSVSLSHTTTTTILTTTTIYLNCFGSLTRLSRVVSLSKHSN